MVVVEVAIERLYLAMVDQPVFIHRGFQQVTVVADDQNGTGEVLQCQRQGLAHLDVEVVGGFVENQQIRLHPGHAGQRHTGFFTAGKRLDHFQCTVAVETESAEEITDFLFAGLGLQALQNQYARGRGIQRLQLMLGKIANANVLAVGTFAVQQRDFFAKGFQQRGFTGAVGAQQADAMTRYD